MSDDKQEGKKNIFEKAVDVFSSRDEKEAAEKAQKELEEAKRAAAAANERAKRADALARAQAQKELDEANKRAKEAEEKLKEMEAALKAKNTAEAKRKQEERIKEIRSNVARHQQPKIITKHTLTSEETLSHLSLKYYGHATKPYWMVIYEANKGVIGDNPNKVHSGMELVIPELPPELKGK